MRTLKNECEEQVVRQTEGRRDGSINSEVDEQTDRVFMGRDIDVETGRKAELRIGWAKTGRESE